ncbi:phenylalanine--tRNA ligase subunit alpha [Candidatus Mycoplasma haematobovis]|uniref:Phenylalanine--tRNA ligase subunit alpha n=1 Tax=Candidatus Mycoplasma haematobovis TaxID=432608 RepID=A0A1A9QCC8_9MOLU|nr:phenylalanine--tRNA ligase subunit alpha [Candidatus Mycoplasma haematobovis]OAL10232.1 phenylalanine--tRNA ligase subunit alpha [Candidatus Mycoplasma haematobovis]
MIKEKIKNAKDIQEALALKKAFEEEYINVLKEEIAIASVDQKKELGIRINTLKKEVEEAFYEFKKLYEEKALNIDTLDLSIPNLNFNNYSLNYLSEIKSDLIKLFYSLGFHIEAGKEVVTEEEAFDNLCFTPDHPSKSESETFYFNNGTILRPHCTTNSIIFLKENKGNKCATIGAVYRKDDESARHTHQFTQLDFVWVEKGMNLANLKWMLGVITKAIFGENREYRFRNSYFPFTQPSLEIDMRCTCTSKNCKICKGSGWIEVLGAGLLKSEILNNFGYSSEYEAIAGGVGLERLAMIKYHISDIRKLYTNNFSFLRDDYY